MKKKQKNSKYMGACPEIKWVLNKPEKKQQKTKKIKIINGNMKVQPRFNDKQFIFQTTAHYDATFHVLYNSYINFQEFQEYCNLETTKNNTFFNAIYDYANSKSSKNYEINRVSILLEISAPEYFIFIDNISCQKKIGYYFSKLMGENYSIIRKTLCEICDIQTLHSYNHIVAYDSFTIDNLKKENYVEELLYHNSKKLVGSNCGHLLKLNYVFYNYVAIDLENQNINADLYAINDRFIL